MAPLLKGVVIFAICMVAIPNFMFAFSLFSAVFSVGSSFFVSAACFAIGVIITLGNCKTYKEVSGGKNESSPFLCVNSSFSYIKYVYAAFIFSNVL